MQQCSPGGGHEKEKNGRKGGMDRGLGRELHLGPYPFRTIFLPAKSRPGHGGRGPDRCRRCRSAVLSAMAAPVDTVLEAHACALWLVLYGCRLDRLGIRRPRVSRVQLVESALASTRSKPVWVFE